MRRKYSANEVAIIARHYPDLDKLLALLPGRSRLSIRGKAGELGLCKKRADDWTLSEIRIVENLYPDVDAIRDQLPHRTRLAITTRAILLGIAVKRKRWTDDHHQVLKTLSAEMSDTEVGAILGVSSMAVYFRRKKLGLTKLAKPKLSRARVPLVQDIRDEAARRGLQIGKITNALGLRKFRPSTTDTSMSWSSAAKTVSALGGQLYIEWHD